MSAPAATAFRIAATSSNCIFTHRPDYLIDKFELPRNAGIIVFGHVHPPIDGMARFGVLNEKEQQG
jgi:hypothetical protein